jgi:uncharacterized protein YbcI
MGSFGEGEHGGAPADRGESLLGRISTDIVRWQKEAFGKGPTSAKSYMVDDMLFVVLRGGLTVAEKTMLGFGRHDLVREFRQQFENDMTSRIVGIIEELTDRKVLTYQSQIMFDPDVIVEMFVFDRTLDEEALFLLGEALIDDQPGDEALPDQSPPRG